MSKKPFAITCALASALSISSPAAVQCLDVEILVSGGVYEAGDQVSVDLLIQCVGGDWCNLCQIRLALDSGCGPEVGFVFVGSAPPESFGMVSLEISLPDDLPPGTYHVCAAPSCVGCSSICQTCCDCCPFGNVPIVVRCPADVDGSGAIDLEDLLVVLSTWGPCGGCSGDVDGDGIVGFDDLLEVLYWWGPCG